MGFPILTSEQSKKALHYAVLWLERETKEIVKSIELCPDGGLKDLMVKRKAELDRDYAELSALNN